MLKCMILDDYQKVALQSADWSVLHSKVSITVLHHHIDNEQALVNALKDQDILVVMRERTLFNKNVLSQLPNLKLIVTSGMRNASIDLQAAAQYGITVCGTDNLSEPACEITWALLLGLARHIVPENQALKTHGPWQSTVGLGLRGKQLGLLGLGKIGTQVAQIAQAFGMRVAAWSQNLSKERTDECGVFLAPSKEALLETSDFISIHLVLSERTRHLIRKEDLCKMQTHAYLINTSRGPIICEKDLIQALNERWIAGAGLDVFEIEPLPVDHPFRTLSNVLATPHLGYVTQENYAIYFQEAIENIQAYLNGKIIRELS